MNLFTTELRRLFHRRLTWALAASLLAVSAIIGVVTFVQHDAAPPDQALARSVAEQQMASCREAMGAEPGWTAQEIDDNCYVDPAWTLQDQRFQLQSVLGGGGDQPWSAVVAQQGRQPFDTATFPGSDQVPDTNPAFGRGGVVISMGMFAALLAAALGASFLGAEWKAGTIESQLVWEPRRRRLLAAKFAAAATGGALLTVLTVGATVLMLVPSAIWRGGAANTGVDFWLDLASTTGRLALVGMFFAVFAAAVATLARNTVAGLGVVFGLAIVGLVLGQVLGWLPAVDLFTNAGAWATTADVSHNLKVYDGFGGYMVYSVIDHGWMTAGLVTALYGAVAAACTTSVFARRDLS